MGLVSNEDEIVDIELKELKKKRFRINGDSDKILELNISDMEIAERMETNYKKILDVMKSISDLNNEDEELTPKMKEADEQIREYLDAIFDSNVSEVCGTGGTMYDPINGTFRFEYIIETLANLYKNNLDAEFKKIKQRVQKHTDKYTKKTTKKS